MKDLKVNVPSVMREFIMTLISTIISNLCVAHASDSLISIMQSDGSYATVDESAKIIEVRKWSGAMACFGVARTGANWDILTHLRAQVELHSANCSEPEDFADLICESLERIPAVEQEGIGIHFTAYEDCNGYLIPELFMITNLKVVEGEYKIDPKGLHFRRETYAKIQPQEDRSPRTEHGKSVFRHQVREFLDNGNIYIYNNGDPVLFNLSVNSIFGMLQIANQRKLFRQFTSANEYRNLAIWPIEQVKRLQEEFFILGNQIVGGPVYSLSITPDGIYTHKKHDGSR